MVNGVVVDKKENTSNHASEMVIFSNGTNFSWSDDVWKVPGFYDIIDSGDSINKPIGSLVIEIHKLDTIVYFDMLKSCKGYNSD